MLSHERQKEYRIYIYRRLLLTH